MTTKIEVPSPLYLHPLDANNFLFVEKLQGTINYKSWKRSIEIVLASKTKPSFITGAMKKDPANSVKVEACETCNSMIISWILSSMTDPIKRSLMFVNNAHKIWT